MIGKTVSHYNILEKIGSGGMGEVYLAEDKILRRKVALKFLPPQAVSETEKSRFIQEAQAAAAINHPNVCTVYEIEEQAEPPFIAMEFVDGHTLKSMIGGKSLTIDECITLAIQVADGLQAAHEQGVVHRDIKSDNIMICGEDRVKVMDFGLAKLKGTLKLTKSSSTIGTLAYMAPEQIEGKKVDARSDIFSFGIVLYEMITNQLPFKGDYDAALMYAIINEEPTPVQELRTELPPELLHVLNRAMEKNPEDRYQSVKEMLIDLKRLKRDSSRVSRTVLQDITMEKKSRKSGKNVLLGILITVVVLLAVYSMYDLWFSEDAREVTVSDDRSLAVMYFSNNTGEEDLDHWRRALSDLMIADLSQSKYLKVLSADKLYDILREMDQLDATNFSAEILREISERGRISTIIFGNISKAGDNFRINVTLKKPITEELISTEMVEGKGEESFFPMVDDLTSRIKENFAFTQKEVSSDIDLRVENITTSSPEAYKYYVQGCEQFDQRDYRESIQSYEKAITHDPEFAMAYRTMAIAYGNMGYRSERRDNLKKAMKLAHRVSTREKYLITGDYYYDSDKRKAIASYENLLAIYPYDVTGNINLGYLYNGLNELNKAVRCFKNAIIGDPSVFIAYMNSAWTYTELAQYDSVRYILEKYKSNYEDNESIRAYFSELHLYEHEYDLALIEIGKAIDFKPADHSNFELKGDIFLCMAQFDSAEKIYRRLLTWDEETAHRSGRSRLWALALLQGKTREMKNEVEAGLKLSRELGEKGWECSFLFSDAEIEKLFGNYMNALHLYEKIISIAQENNLFWLYHWALHYKADMFSKLNRLEEAKQIAQELRKINLNDLNRWWHGNYLFLYGKIALAEGNFGEAADSLQRAIAVLNPNPQRITNAYIYYWLAQAYDKNGNPDKAIEWYNKLVSLTVGRIRTGHIYVKSFYFLAKIYQKKGWEGKAIEHFEKFLNLWQEADYTFPQIEDAWKQLAILQNR